MADREVAMPSPMRVRCRPGSETKSSPTVAEMAEMSPMCSIMAAMAMGAMTRMEVRSNLAMKKSGMFTTSVTVLTAMLDRSTSAEPSGLVTPKALRIRATA